MTGLEKIIREIRDEAAAEAQAVTDRARAERERILTAAKRESDGVCQKIASQAAQEVAEAERGCASALDLQRRQKLLDTKQQLLAETIEQALQALTKLPEQEYFSLLLKMAAKYAEQGEGTLLLNQTDRARVPADFSKKLAGVLPAGASITVSEETRPVDGGFVLKYGEIEENCSFRAMFDTRRDELADRIVPILFG